ncbi:MAG: hypothetical protein JHC34_05650 [Acidobacteria bacterium]|nr:hypothetical protein [Acidobacteriota bacterium]
MKMSFAAVAAVLLLCATGFFAQVAQPSPQDLQQQIQALQAQMQAMARDYQAKLDELQKQLEALKSQQQASGAPPSQGGVPQYEGTAPPLPASATGANALANPAISLIPDMIASGGNDPYWLGQPNAYMREVEIAFSAAIDPYANAFAALSLEDGQLNVEEGYAAFPALWGGFSAKLGKFKADFGKNNQMHSHTWFQADQPLALREILGEEGFSDTGLSLSHLLPTPWTSDITVEVTSGRADLFGGSRSSLAYLAAWRNYWDLTDNSNLEAQLSLSAGKNAQNGTTKLGNLSVTYRYKPIGNRRESFIWRTEYLRKDVDFENVVTPDDPSQPSYLVEGADRWKGAFSYVDWQFARGWFLGTRGDWVRHPDGGNDSGGALVLTWFPSEFQKFRLQYARTNYAGIGMRDAVVFEYGFAIGPHGAHPF